MENFYKTTKWKKKRKAILNRDKGRCILCERLDGSITPATVVHHIVPREDTTLLELDSNNLVSLCAACHNKCHGKNGTLTELGRELVRKFCKDNGYPPSLLEGLR